MNLLTDDNFLLYCAKHYDNPQCTTTEEFESDLRRIYYVKKLCTRFKETNKPDIRLILNHIIILNNLFGPEALPRILYLKAKDHFEVIKPLLIFIGIMPDEFKDIVIRGYVVTTNIKLCPEVIEELRKI